MQIAQYITHSGVYGKEATLEDIRRLLSKVDCRVILTFCCTIGIVLRLWTRQGVDPVVYSQLIRKFFSSPIAAVILQRFPSWQVFSRRQLLALERLAIQNYQETPTLSEQATAQAFGMLCTMVNDRLHYGLAGTETENEKIMRNLFVEMIPISENTGSNIYARTTRAVILMKEVADSMASDPDYIDFSAEFHHAIGVQLSEFHASCMAILSKWVNFDAKKPHQADDIFLMPGWLRTVALDNVVVEKVLDVLSSNIFAYKEAFTGKRNEDFTPFRERPLLRIGPGYLPTDLEFRGQTGRNLFNSSTALLPTRFRIACTR